MYALRGPSVVETMLEVLVLIAFLLLTAIVAFVVYLPFVPRDTPSLGYVWNVNKTHKSKELELGIPKYAMQMCGKAVKSYCKLPTILATPKYASVFAKSLLIVASDAFLHLMAFM